MLSDMTVCQSVFSANIVTACFLLSYPNPVAAVTWTIVHDGSGDAYSIQAGIDSAAAGDTVLVKAGVYPEAIDFQGKNIVVSSSSGPDETIIDATGLGSRVVTFSSGERRQATLRGFTITGGMGGIGILEAEPTILDNIISNNIGAENGGGIACGGTIAIPAWTPLIKGNIISGNRANSLAGGIGADIVKPEIIDNYIDNNEASRGDGGGIYYRSVHDGAVIKGNFIRGNYAGDHGGGIYVGRLGDGVLSLEISYNLVSGNQSDGQAMTGDSGGGIWLWETNAWLHHNTVVGNTGNGPNNSYGGGLVIQQPSSPTIEQNIIAFSQAGGGILCGGGTTPTIRNNMAWQNSGGDGLGTCPGWESSNGNVVDNPYFCDMAGGDYRVASNSGVMTHPAGPLGAFPIPGCGPVFVQPITWGALKARYRSTQ